MKTNKQPAITFQKIKDGDYRLIQRLDSNDFCLDVEGQGINEFFKLSRKEATEKDEDGALLYPDGLGWYYYFMSEFAPETPKGPDLSFHGPFKSKVLAAEDAARRMKLLI